MFYDFAMASYLQVENPNVLEHINNYNRTQKIKLIFLLNTVVCNHYNKNTIINKSS